MFKSRQNVGRAKPSESLFKRLTRSVGNAGLRVVIQLKNKFVQKLTRESVPQEVQRHPAPSQQPRDPAQEQQRRYQWQQPRRAVSAPELFQMLVNNGGNVGNAVAQTGLSRAFVDDFVFSQRERLEFAREQKGRLLRIGDFFAVELPQENLAGPSFWMEKNRVY